MKATDELDRLLSSGDAIAPSAGFVRSVMSAVRQAAEEPPPLPFPWGRLALGIAACGVLAATGTILIARAAPSLLAFDLAGFAPVAWQLGYAALGVAGSLALARLPRLLVRS